MPASSKNVTFFYSFDIFKLLILPFDIGLSVFELFTEFDIFWFCNPSIDIYVYKLLRKKSEIFEMDNWYS